MRDMMEEVYEVLSSDELLGKLTIRSHVRPETLKDDEASIVIVPLAPPEARVHGSDSFLARRFSYQINVEASSRVETKVLANRVQERLKLLNFYQTPGGLDEYVETVGRYVDARTYRGTSPIYQDY